MKTLALDTFNVHGLTKFHKQQQLILKVTRYKIDLCVIQERYILGQLESYSLKLNFHTTLMVSIGVSVLQIQHRKLSNTKKCAWTIKETSSEFKESVCLNFQLNGVSYKCLLIPKITIKREFIPDSKYIINIIKVYATTSHFVRDDVSVLEKFYKDVTTILNELKNKSLVLSTGDWNAKVRKKIKQYTSNNCIEHFTHSV